MRGKVWVSVKDIPVHSVKLSAQISFVFSFFFCFSETLQVDNGKSVCSFDVPTQFIYFLGGRSEVFRQACILSVGFSHYNIGNIVYNGNA